MPLRSVVLSSVILSSLVQHLRTRRVWLRAAALAAALLGACWVGPASAQFQKTPWPPAQPSPVLDLLDLQGQRWRSDQLQGRTVVLNFWATWCPPCKEEMPSLQTLHEIGGGDPVVIGVNVRETATRVRRYLASTGIDFPVVLDPQAELARRLGVSAFPTTLLIGPDGRVRWRVLGEVDWSGPDAARWIAELSAGGRSAPARR